MARTWFGYKIPVDDILRMVIKSEDHNRFITYPDICISSEKITGGGNECVMTDDKTPRELFDIAAVKIESFDVRIDPADLLHGWIIIEDICGNTFVEITPDKMARADRLVAQLVREQRLSSRPPMTLLQY